MNHANFGPSTFQHHASTLLEMATAVAALVAGLGVEALFRIIEACSEEVQVQVQVQVQVHDHVQEEASELGYHDAMKRYDDLNTPDTGEWIEIA